MQVFPKMLDTYCYHDGLQLKIINYLNLELGNIIYYITLLIQEIKSSIICRLFSSP